MIFALPAMKLRILAMVLIIPEAIDPRPFFEKKAVQPSSLLKIGSVTGVFYTTLEKVRNKSTIPRSLQKKFILNY